MRDRSANAGSSSIIAGKRGDADSAPGRLGDSPLACLTDLVSSPAMSKPNTDGAPRAPRGLAATTWGPGRLDRFWVDEDRALWHAAWISGAWAEPESLGGTLASAPAAVAWSEGEMEVFAVMHDGELWNRYWDRTYWHQWESLGGELDATAAPAASSWGAERLDVYALGRDGRTWHRWWDGSRWVDWEQL
jgi:hypothetical protein